MKNFADLHQPDFIFLSEPQMFAHDLALAMRSLSPAYMASLNSADKYDSELPFLKSRTKGGTLIMWKRSLDPFISVWPVSTTSFLPILFHPPNSPLTVHIAVYLPTSGQESQFLEDLSNLSMVMDELHDAHPAAQFYLRGDFNASLRNTKRSDLLSHFCNEKNLLDVPIHHPTYHHFLGNGQSDSYLDKLLYPKAALYPEVLLDIHCKLSNPLINSHHDMIFSSWSLPHVEEEDWSENNVVAPKIKNTRLKIIWSDDGVQEYQKLVEPHLSRLQELWLSPPSRNSIKLLLESTNSVLISSAALTNKTIPLNGTSSKKNSSKTPRHIKLSQNKLKKLYKNLQREAALNSPHLASLKEEYNKARSMHRKLERVHKAGCSAQRDEKLFSIISTDPSPVYRGIKSTKRSTAGKLHKLKVGSKTYVGDKVQDGFYDSISHLKFRDQAALNSSTTFKNFSADFTNILEICKHGSPIPPISEMDCFKLMQRMKPTVNDVNGITINHYIHAGPAGIKHFHLLLSCLLNDVNNTDIEEINTVYACILFKGHNKDKTSDRSYRTISSCPVIAKALDLYIRDLHIESWNLDQAETQFQGEGSSHELAAVLLTEAIQLSLHTSKEPVYVLYLDAKSAFDVVLQELLVRNLFNCNTSGHSLLYINNRLGNRKTFIDWGDNLLGPVHDEQGLEQGGVNSSDFYKIFGKEQLTTAQDSQLGVKLGSLTVSGIGQADDTALLSNCLFKLFCLLQLTIAFCKRYQVTLCHEKTKLQVFSTSKMKTLVDYAVQTNPIHLNGKKINFSDSAEHVGMLRSSSGNLPTILARFIAHNNALGGVLHTGIARGHRGNPAASIHVDRVYGVPVLLSGLAPLVLSEPEQSLINQHHKDKMSNFQRLLPCTPRAVIYFLGGSLPGVALLHLRQLSIFGMITRLPENILNKLATSVFSSSVPITKSWFGQVQDLCTKYHLPQPLQLLQSPLSKYQMKKLCKKQVLNYWEELLRAEAEDPRYSSLVYFKPRFMSLSTPHPLWTSAGPSSSKVAMASVQAQMLSGRYRTEGLCRHWSLKNKEGHCLLSTACSNTVEDIPHILLHCVALQDIRAKLSLFTISYCKNIPYVISNLILSLSLPSNPHFCQFLLDCSVLPEVMRATQLFGEDVLHHAFNITRRWVYSLHKTRMKILGRWNPI